MSTTETQAPPAASTNQPRRGNHHGRNRRPRPSAPAQDTSTPQSGEAPTRRRGGAGRNAALSMRPASLAPNPTPASGNARNETNSGETPGGRRRPRRDRGRVGVPRPQRTVNGRAFGGALTQDASDLTNGHLQAQAAEFVPGQPLVPSQALQGPPVNAPRRQRRASKSTAPDIMTRTHEDIEHAQYECPICTSEVQRNSKVWSCHTCWTVFHLSCIKKWASNEGSAAARRASLTNGELPPPRQWRCPGCNLAKDEQPKTYTCWCGKETDPRPPTGIPPHSCGNTCGKDRARKCPHPCQITCHAGPCSPCTYMGPSQSCFCGKNELTKRCVDTDYENGWSCDEICGDIMPCGVHTCPRPCHEGLCGGCEESVQARCYCGQEDKQIPCCEQGDPRPSQRQSPGQAADQVVDEWVGNYQCVNLCDRPFDCGIHMCEQSCHPQDLLPAHCPRSPDVVRSCPCGKAPLHELSGQPRSSCNDSIPNCDKLCMKPLSCGHGCEQKCHAGECLPCMKTVTISCQCGRTNASTICHQGAEFQPQCFRVCHATLSCGRHACDERCCTGERKASERLSVKKKSRPLGSAPPPPADLVEAEHICTRVCGRPLKCGNHTCEELCHRGPCRSCREAIFDEITCHCGRTSLEPPLPCGTSPPPCRFQCERSKSCGHPHVQHNCHQDSESCPKCPFLVSRDCMCGKKTLKNQPCFLSSVSCGQICGLKLRCGSHFCRKPCHRPGECEDSAVNTSCTQPCAKAKKNCGHPDEAPCHAPYPCKEDKPCASKTVITCPCQAQKQEVRCNATLSSEGNATARTLACTDECARLARNARLAAALHIDPSSASHGAASIEATHVPYSDETLDLYGALPTSFAQSQEREFRVFAVDESERRLRFKPMRPAERAFLHALADDFGLDSESLDPEPHRHVLVLKTPRFPGTAPAKTVGEAARIRALKRKLVVATVGRAEKEVAKKPVGDESSRAPFNALVLVGARFGLTVEEVRGAILAAAAAATVGPEVRFDIVFLPSEEVLLKPMGGGLGLEQTLRAVKPGLDESVRASELGTTLVLCAVDASSNIVRRETDAALAAAADGWSRVAAKGAAPRRAPAASSHMGAPNAYAALSGVGGSGMVTFAKKKKVKEAVVEEPVLDDWEAEMDRVEEVGGLTQGIARAGDGEAGLSGGEEIESDEDGVRLDAGVLDAKVGGVKESETERSEAKESEAKESEAKENEVKEDEVKENEVEEDEVKESETEKNKMESKVKEAEGEVKESERGKSETRE